MGKVGLLENGAFGDVIAMPGNPLADIGAVEHVEVVIKGGQLVRDDRR